MLHLKVIHSKETMAPHLHSRATDILHKDRRRLKDIHHRDSSHLRDSHHKDNRIRLRRYRLDMGDRQHSHLLAMALSKQRLLT